MALESAKCPNCAAEIQVPNDREDTFCAYCGSKIKTRAAIGFFQVEIKGKVQIDTTSTVQAKLQRGRETGDIKYYIEALDLDPNCYEAKLGIAEFGFCNKQKYGWQNIIYYRITGSMSKSEYHLAEAKRSFNYRFELIFPNGDNSSNAFLSLKDNDQADIIRQAAEIFVTRGQKDFISGECNTVFGDLTRLLELSTIDSTAIKKHVDVILCCAKQLYNACNVHSILIPEKGLMAKLTVNDQIKGIERALSRIRQLGYL